jgi:hypothetical protein
MPFPVDLEALLAAGYEYLLPMTYPVSDKCPDCGEPVEIFKTPSKRTIALQPMMLQTSPAVFHSCNNRTNPVAPPQIRMYGVTDKNMMACGWQDGMLVIAFRHGRYQYANVPENIFVTLRKVPYPNNYFTKAVKNHPELYPFTKLS